MAPSKKRRPDKPPLMLGWREWMGLPDLDIPALKVKLDTGARSSALHVTDIRLFRRRNEDWVRFRPVLDDGRPRLRAAEARVLDQRMVRDSGGREHLRVVIKTAIEVAGWIWPVDLTLASRGEMSFRMLLGRQAMSGRIIVDPVHSYLAGRRTSMRKRRVPKRKTS
jgi:hypothetical protein